MEKTVSKAIIAIIIFSLLTGCQREEFIDLSGFINGSNENGANLSIDDFYIEKSDTKGNIYYSFIEKEESIIMLKLLCDETDKITQVRIFLPKAGENGKVKEISTEEKDLFLSAAIYSICAFTDCDKAAAEKLLKEMTLYDKSAYINEGELTKEEGKFYYIYLSSYPGSELIIHNTYLSKPEKTEKPVSKPLYGERGTTREDTESLE